MASIEKDVAAFVSGFERGEDVAALRQQLVKLKIALTEHGLLQSTNQKDRDLARNVLEVAALLSVKTSDIAGFERNVAQLQTYFSSSDSPRKYEIVGLNLLRLLAMDKMAEFHTELELVPVAVRSSERTISYPVAMEQYMMEGSYHKVIASAGRIPAPSFALFTKMLGETVRAQIAECISRAYVSLTTKQAAELLMLASEAELNQFESQFGWTKGPNGAYDFSKGAAEVRVPKVQVMMETLGLAEELERII